MASREIYSESQSRKNKNLFYILLSIIIILSLSAIIMIFFVLSKQKEVHDAVDKIHLPVVSIKAEKGNLQRTIVINGYLESENRVDIIPMVTGAVTSIPVNEGQWLEKGALVATIDSQALELNLQQVENAFNTAESAYLRIKSLYDKKMTSTQNLEKAESEYKSTQSMLESARLQYQYSFVTTPISGIVLDIYTTTGSHAGNGQPLMVISNPDQLTIKNQIPELYYETFARKMEDIELNIRRPADDNGSISGRIITISRFISPETKTFTVKCSVNQDQSFLIPGMFVKTEFILEEHKDIYILPFDILMGGNKLWYLGDPADGESLYRASSIIFEPDFYNNSYFEIDEQFADFVFLKEGQDFIFEEQIIRLKSGPET